MENIREEITINYFLENPTMYIKEIGKVLKIPTSTVQRYLKKHERDYIPTLGITIKEQLRINRESGNSKGGNKTFSSYTAIKNKKGEFIGLEKTKSPVSKKETKEKDILEITKFYLEHSNLSLTEISEHFNFTKDYIYDCLTSNKTKNILGIEIYSKIQELLNQNTKSFNRKSLNIDLSDDNLSILDNIELEIITLRYKSHLTQEEIGKKLKVSRTIIMEIENKALKKLEQNESSKKR